MGATRRGAPDAALLDEIRTKAAALGRAPRASEVQGPDTFRDRFGSWKRAVVLAGLEPAPHASRKDQSPIRPPVRTLGKVVPRRVSRHAPLPSNLVAYRAWLEHERLPKNEAYRALIREAAAEYDALLAREKAKKRGGRPRKSPLPPMAVGRNAA